MNKLQSKLLEMFVWLTNFLDNNNLRYYIIGGTMLGAVRHKGFIPWDDDIDIAMPRTDYEKLLDKLRKPIDNYYVESPKDDKNDFPYTYAKFYDINTTMIEEARKNIVRGIFIDIFPLDGIGDSIDESLKNYKKIDKKNMLLAMKVAKYRKGRKWWKNIAAFLGVLLPINIKKMTREIDLLCSKKNFDDALYVGNLVSRYRSKEIMKKEIFGTPTLYEFEGIKVYGPELYDKYLTILFGDWNKLPEEKNRKTIHDFISVDYNKSFLENE